MNAQSSYFGANGEKRADDLSPTPPPFPALVPRRILVLPTVDPGIVWCVVADRGGGCLMFCELECFWRETTGFGCRWFSMNKKLRGWDVVCVSSQCSPNFDPVKESRGFRGCCRWAISREVLVQPVRVFAALGHGVHAAAAPVLRLAASHAARPIRWIGRCAVAESMLASQ